jgi:hypothetical protein
MLKSTQLLLWIRSFRVELNGGMFLRNAGNYLQDNKGAITPKITIPDVVCTELRTETPGPSKSLLSIAFDGSQEIDNKR